MSARPGKALIAGLTEVSGERAFVLKLVRSRAPAGTNRIELARFDARASWLDHLESLERPGWAPFGEPLRLRAENGNGDGNGNGNGHPAAVRDRALAERLAL